MLTNSKKKRKVRRKRTTVRTVWGCPRTKNRSSWCYGMCTPVNGLGECGRPAGHDMLSRTQLAILKDLAKKKAKSEKSQ